MEKIKFNKTYKFAFISASLLALLALLILVILQLFIEMHVPLNAAVIFLVFLFIFSFVIIQYRVETFIYKRIKEIYKSISIDTQGLDKQSVTSNMETFSKNLKRFSENQSLEIKLLKEREIYRREFLGNIAHELKTPLFTVQGYLLTLLDGGMDDKNIRIKYLERANSGVDRLNHIVKDLDMISKLETGDLSLKYSNFDIISLVEEVFNLLEIESKKRNVLLRFDRNYEFSILVNADKNRIQQVLINLIINAIYYGKNVCIVSIIPHKQNKLKITIKDDGDGIPPKELPRLFERFYRIDKSRSRNQGGSGLGLSIVKHIIEAHNETFFVESELQKGSTFSFTLQEIL